jgi:peptidoglycan/LPS O-acetylase OafA/YrhL
MTQMTDTTVARSTREARFADELEAIGHRTSRGDRRQVQVAATVMVLGVAVAIVAYAMSTGQSDTRDVISSVILAVVGLCLVVGGAAVFVRSSMTEFLRFWMLRLLFEQQRGEDR